MRLLLQPAGLPPIVGLDIGGVNVPALRLDTTAGLKYLKKHDTLTVPPTAISACKAYLRQNAGCRHALHQRW